MFYLYFTCFKTWKWLNSDFFVPPYLNESTLKTDWKLTIHMTNKKYVLILLYIHHWFRSCYAQESKLLDCWMKPYHCENSQLSTFCLPGRWLSSWLRTLSNVVQKQWSLCDRCHRCQWGSFEVWPQAPQRRVKCLSWSFTRFLFVTLTPFFRDGTTPGAFKKEE